MPKISVVLPVYLGAESLARAISSIQGQTVSDWELLVINEFGSSDGSSAIAEEFSKADPRIRLIQNTQRLGLAGSLNVGIREAKGQWIARMDADDVSLPQRFEKQLALFEKNPRLGICGTFQEHIGSGIHEIHAPPTEPSELAASLLFSCELCHSTVMMRKSVLEEHGLFYHEDAQAEDFELWTRAIFVTQLSNVPEVLGTYHCGETITQEKMQALEQEHGRICATTLKRAFGISLTEEQIPLLDAWKNIFLWEKNPCKRRKKTADYLGILLQIWNANETQKRFEPSVLARVLRRRWLWARWGLRPKQVTARTKADIFTPVAFPVCKLIRQTLRGNLTPLSIIKKAMR